MRAITRGGTLAVVLVAVAMVTTTMPAMASHNSAGAWAHVSQADEVDNEGNLQADVPRDHPFAQAFHDELDPPREQPPDQRGDRYTDCTTAEDAGDNYDPANNEDHCYIGFFDAQWEYMTHAALAVSFTAQSDGDGLYSVNPESSDDYCTGQTESGIQNQLIARVQRTQDDECAGSTHKAYNPTHVFIDQDLVEAPFQSDQNVGPGATDVVGTPSASGTQTIPAMSRPYLFIFGEPHPDANPASGERFEAGEGPFGPSPTEGGNPLLDLTGACGDRTEQCKLLTPEDIKKYDTRYNPDFVESDEARVCGYAPQFSVLNPASLGEGPCGPFGATVGDFVGRTSYGGLGIDGAPDTWLTIQPGWTRDVSYVAGSQWQLFVDEERTPAPIERPCRQDMEHRDMCGAYFSDDPEMAPGTFVIYAVNPRVPSLDHDLWCLQPNILGPVGTPVYGYAGDAFDFDLYTHFLVGPADDALQATHPVVHTVASPVEPLLDVNTPAELLRGGAEDAVKNALGSGNEGTYERADYTDDGKAAPHNTPGNTQQDFTTTVGSQDGFFCQPNGVIQQGESEPLTGGLVIDVDVDTQQGGVAVAPLGIPVTSVPPQKLKDPTATGDDGTPAREDETRWGTWRPTLYSFGGTVAGVLDDNGNGEFDQCKQFTLQPQPSRDSCPWRAIWDAYNPSCTGPDGETECGAYLEKNGYDVDGTDSNEPSGVGLYWTLNITGPVVLVDEDADPANDGADAAPQIVGDANPTAENCIVGISQGFQDHITDLFPGTTNAQEAAEEICEGAGGETIVITDAFNGQGGAGGGFSSAIQFAKAAPTPEAVRDATGGFADSDEICIHGSWAVQDGFGSTTDTKGDLELDDTGEPWRFTDCDSLASGS